MLRSFSMSTNLQHKSDSLPCRHCLGAGYEPSPLRLKFSRAGSLRGDLSRLARSSRISEPMISATFSGRKLPSIRTLVAIAAALSRILGHPVTVDRLIAMPAIRRMLTGKRPAA